MPTLAKLEYDTRKWENEQRRQQRQKESKTPILGFGSGKKKKKSRSTAKWDDTADILALNREYRAKNRAEDRVRRQVYNDTMDLVNDCLERTSQVSIPHVEKETDRVEARLNRVRKNIRDYSISELQQVQADVKRFVQRRYELHGIALGVNQLLGRWNAYAERMYAVEASLEHCNKYIQICEQLVDQLVSGVKKGETTQAQFNHASQEVYSRLEHCLYPQLNFAEALAKLMVVKKRILAMVRERNGIPKAEADEFSEMNIRLATMTTAAQTHEKVAEEAEVTRLHDEFVRLEEQLLAAPESSFSFVPPPIPTSNTKQYTSTAANTAPDAALTHQMQQWEPFNAQTAAPESTPTQYTKQWKPVHAQTVQRKRFFDDNVWGDYEGQLDEQGQRHGRAKMVWENGYHYQGDFVNDVREGQGTLTYPNGNRYVGGFYDNRRHGRALFYYDDGVVEMGRYDMGEDFGEGVGWRPRGQSAMRLLDGKPQGTISLVQGADIARRIGLPLPDGVVMPTPSGPTKRVYVQDKRYCDDEAWGNYEGTVNAQGQRHGKGKIVWENGYEYEGDFVEDLRNGHGTMKYPNGNKYVGDFYDNRRHGWAVFWYNDGVVEMGRYNMGQETGEGVGWSPDRASAMLLLDGKPQGQVSLAQAATIARRVGLPIPN